MKTTLDNGGASSRAGPTSARIWLITGATGFIGREILRRLLTRGDDDIIILVRPRRGGSVAERGQALLQGLFPGGVDPRMAARVRVQAGDTTQPQLGLNNADWRSLSQVSHIVHLAALTRFDASLDQARRHNVYGTATLIELARMAHAAGNLERYLHVSTAYVAGATTERVNAEQLDPERRFRNSYEQSKCEAEMLVRASRDDIPTVVFRPSIVIGDSETGEVVGFNTIYWSVRQYLRGMSVVIARPQTPLDMVPVDYVADAMLEIASKSEALGGTFLLAGGERTTVPLVQLAQQICAYLGTPVPRILPPVTLTLLRCLLRLPNARRKYGRFVSQVECYLPYFVQNPTFDVGATERILADSTIRVPALETYVGRLMDYCLVQGWGRGSPMLAKSSNRQHRRSAAITTLPS